MRMIINSGGQNYGPYTVEEVNHLLSTGSILENDFAWCDNATEWSSVDEALAALTPKPLSRRTGLAEIDNRNYRTSKAASWDAYI